MNKLYIHCSLVSDLAKKIFESMGTQSKDGFV